MCQGHRSSRSGAEGHDSCCGAGELGLAEIRLRSGRTAARDGRVHGQQRGQSAGWVRGLAGCMLRSGAAISALGKSQ
eukprot:15463349-Alexandrium_andersonii.AAC.1